MDHEAGMAVQPALNDWVFVCAVVVHNEMEVLFFGEFIIEALQELEEFLMPMAGTGRSLFLVRLQAQQKEWLCRSAYSHESSCRNSLSSWAVQRLDLALLIHTEHECFLWRIEIKAHDIGEFLQEFGVPRELEAIRSMWLHAIYD